MFPEDDWDDFIKTPPPINSFVQMEMQEQGVILPQQNFPSFMPRSPSMPTFIYQDPMSTLEFLGLDSPLGLDENEISNRERQKCPEIESRTILISKLPENTKAESIKALMPTTVPIKSISNHDKTSVLIDFFDLRHSQYFRHHFDNMTFKGHIIEARFAPPQNAVPHQKPPNNGTIVIFHLNPIITNTQLETSFCAFGEIRQIRGTPSKPTQRFIEYWDTRCAASALKAMNGKSLLGSKVSIEFSIPGGLRKNFSKQRLQ